jgi:hypothetical protein
MISFWANKLGWVKMTFKSTGWTKEKRARVALRTKLQKPWLKSTGPRTVAGKARSSQNAYRHGRRSARYITAYRRLSGLLWLQKRRIKAIINAARPSKTLYFMPAAFYTARL